MAQQKAAHGALERAAEQDASKRDLQAEVREGHLGIEHAGGLAWHA
jgi:hypothetical protein